MKPRGGRRMRTVPGREAIEAALGALPEGDRVLLSLQLLEGMTALEIAGALRVTAREVETRTRALLRSLRLETGPVAAPRRAA